MCVSTWCLLMVFWEGVETLADGASLEKYNVGDRPLAYDLSLIQASLFFHLIMQMEVPLKQAATTYPKIHGSAFPAMINCIS